MSGPARKLPVECRRCQDELDAVLIGIADAPTRQVVLAHLASCPDCARDAADLRQALGGLLHAPPPVPLPTGARERLLASARTRTAAVPTPSVQPQPSLPPRTARQRQRPRTAAWLTAGLGLTAALAAFLLWPTITPSSHQADVVVGAGESLVLARSETSPYPLMIRSAGGQLRGVALKQARPAWYTEGVYQDGRAYLLDAANERLIVLNVADGRVERSYPTPGGAAGLAIKDGSVFVKSAASGELRIFKGENCFINKLAAAAAMPQADYMDAVLPLDDRVWVTQHTTGQLFVLSANGEKVLATYQMGGAPVGLRIWQGSVVVLDVQGRLLELDQNGSVERVLRLTGHPDKLSIMDDEAYLTDRGGMVSVVNLKTFTVTGERKFGKPMDIAALADGHLALADAERGLIMLQPDLSEL